ncbi:MAG: hypothetical protein A2Z34_11005 [Planctomycetes bacterium RBG_16_59_8]|nr:MAG: hypothetical protein A2Z34_11005 [Planctomycetes bacterium RBG_16_59_8]
MIATGHQPNYLPYAGFFHKIVRADVFIVVDTVQFVKRGPFGWIHRNRIRTPDGWDWLSVPALTKGKFTQRIIETKIDRSVPWARKHLRTLEWNYKKAPFFDEYIGVFREVYTKEWDSLCELNIHLIEKLLLLMGISRSMRRTSELGVEGEASALIVNMCRAVGADAYLSGIHGKDYLDIGLFEKSGIRLIFQEFCHPTYTQSQPGAFIPELSVVDMLFNCGPRTVDLLRGAS